MPFKLTFYTKFGFLLVVPPSLQSGCKPLLDTQVHFVASLDEALVKDYRYKQVPYLPVILRQPAATTDLNATA